MLMDVVERVMTMLNLSPEQAKQCNALVDHTWHSTSSQAITYLRNTNYHSVARVDVYA